MKKLIDNYFAASNKICEKFCEKQGFDISDCYWIGEVGCGIFAIIDQYYYSMEDIIYDLKNNIKAGVPMKWIDAVVDYECNNIEKKLKPSMNYQSWCKGVRFTKKFGY